MTLPGVMGPLTARALGAPPVPRELRRPAGVVPDGVHPPQQPASGAVPLGAAPSSPKPPARPSLLDLAFLDDEQASVLLVGAGHSMQTALAAALTRHGVHVETSTGTAVLDAVVAATPSLIVVVGEAARDAGRSVLAELRSVEHGSSVPVAVLMEEPSLDARLRAFGNGATAVILQSPSVDAIAERVATIARSKRGRTGAAAPSNAGLGDTTLSGLLDAVGRRVAARLLPSADTSKLEFDAVRVSLGEGRRVAEIVDDFSTALAPCVLGAERVEYQLNGMSTTALLGEEGIAEAESSGDVSAMRVVLADRNAARADAVAQSLRAHGAAVVVTALDPSARHFATMGQFDPAALMIGIEDLYAAQDLIVRMHADDRLRWAGVLAVKWDEVGFFEDSARAVEGLLGRLAALADPERSLHARAELGDQSDARLEVMGPARVLRALATCTHPVRVTFHNPRATVQVDLSDGLLVGAHARIHQEPGRQIEGIPALAAALLLDEGRVEVERIAEAASANVMNTVDSALDLASREPAPIERVRRPAPAVQSLIAASGDMTELAAPLASSRGAQSEVPPPGVASAGRDRYRLLTIALAALAGALLTLAIVVLVRQTAPKAAALGSSAGEATSAVAPRASSAAVAAAPASLTERASRGDRGALAELEGRPANRRSIDENIALGQGRIALRKAEIEELRQSILARPALLDDRQTVGRLLGFARDPSVAAEALAAVASLPGAKPADIIYEVWIGTPGRSSATALAQEFANSAIVRKNASPQLALALDLRQGKTCEDFRALVPAAKDHGDRRALRPLVQLLRRTGCGDDKRQDCYACLRGDDEALTTAIRAVQGRRAPRL
jgi:DNA-binding response OmpR family regulator